LGAAIRRAWHPARDARRRVERPIDATPTIARQHALLRRVAELVDRGDLVHTLTARIDGLNAAGLKRAHALVEAGDLIGRVVVVKQ
jgi:hypothetical protein